MDYAKTLGREPSKGFHTPRYVVDTLVAESLYETTSIQGVKDLSWNYLPSLRASLTVADRLIWEIKNTLDDARKLQTELQKTLENMAEANTEPNVHVPAAEKIRAKVTVRNVGSGKPHVVAGD